LKTFSDEELVLAARRRGRGDEAFAALVERYAAAVRAVAQHVVRDYHVSEDIAQDVFVSAYGKLEQLRVPSLFGRWILRIARQRALQAARSRRPEVSLEAAADVVCPNSETGPNENGPDMEHLLNALMRLSEREQRLLMLRYFNGHSVAEIARITGRPVGTVTKQLSRGHARLREHLSEIMV